MRMGLRPFARVAAGFGAVALVLLLPVPMLGDFQLLVMQDGALQAVGDTLDADTVVGRTPAGQVRDISLRIRNVGKESAAVTKLDISGAGFQLFNEPTLPLTLTPDMAVAFRIRFRPPLAGQYAGVLRYNGNTVQIQATATAAAAISVEEPDGIRTLGPGSSVSYGVVERRVAITRRFVLTNRNADPLVVTHVFVSGSGFQAQNWQPVTLAPGGSAGFEVAFETSRPGVYSATLEVDGQTVQLDAFVHPAPLPRPTIRLQQKEWASAEQGGLSIEFAAPAGDAGEGEVTIGFAARAGLEGGANPDPGMIFIDSGAKTIRFQYAENATAAAFNGKEAAVFQTGTTAGSLTFTAKLSDAVTAEERIEVQPARVNFSTARITRYANSVEVVLLGFDNARSASRVAFTFAGTDGRTMTPTPLTVDVHNRFAQYFRAGTSGGAFSMRAVFPVTGDVAAVSAVEVEIENSSGVTRTSRIHF